MLQRGFTLVETLAALLILSFVLMTSLLVFTQREKRLRDADEMIVAWQALANEAEYVRLMPYNSFAPDGQKPFNEGSELLASLDRAETSVEAFDWKPGVRRVVLTVTWNGGARHASLTVVRSAVPGGRFW
ncbi:MAG: type II secretion system protein [Acidobacteria bacterium]|nr:type II secretion system protein [Acidobacteriota bacterium]